MPSGEGLLSLGMSDSAQRTTLRASAIMAGALLLSRVLGMLRDSVMLSQFGIGKASDAYQLAVLIPDMVFMLVAGGGLSSAFIPVFSEYWHTDKKSEAWKVFSTVVLSTFAVGIGLVSIAWALTPQIVNFFRDKKPVEIAHLAEPMARIVLPAQIAFLVGSVFLGALYARKSFIGPALAPNVYNIGIILGGLLLPRLMGMGIESMAWGALGGAVIGNLLLPLVLLVRSHAEFHFAFDFSHPGVKKFFRLLLPVILGFSLPSMANIITQKFASMYGSDGINTILRYSNNLMQAPLGVLGQSFALAAFPVLAEFYATKRMDLYREEMSKTLSTVIYLSLPAAALLFSFADPIVNVLYGYGKASNSPQELHGIAACLQVYSIGIMAWCVQPVLMRGFFSLHKTFLPIVISTLLTVAFTGLSWMVIQSQLAYPNLAWASNISAAILAVALFVALEKHTGALDRFHIVQTFLKAFGASLTVGSAAYLMSLAMRGHGRMLEIVILFFGGVGCMWIYYGLTRWSGMTEARYLDRAFGRRRPKPDATAG